MKITNNRGFTLIESLVVLSAFLVITSVSLVWYNPHDELIEKRAFLTQLETDLLYAQQFAISRQHEIVVNFMIEKDFYYFYDRTNAEILIERHYSDPIKMKLGSLSYSFKFLRDGNVNKFGTVYILIGNKKYRLTILIGKGRFYVSEE